MSLSQATRLSHTTVLPFTRLPRWSYGLYPGILEGDMNRIDPSKHHHQLYLGSSVGIVCYDVQSIADGS